MQNSLPFRLLSALIIAAVGAGAPAGVARAVPQCGNSVCDKPQENCANCSRDCGVCAKCGDGKCTKGKETCFRCPEDCGECPAISVAPACGDGICEGAEDCSSCAQDCGACPTGRESMFDRWQKLLFRGGLNQMRRLTRTVRRYARVIASDLQEDAIRRSEAAEELLLFLGENPGIADRFSEADRRLIERVAARRGEMTALNTIVPSTRVAYALRSAARREEKEIARLTATMVEDLHVRRELEALTEFDTLARVVKKGDLAAAATMLPPPRRPLSTLRKELDALEDIVGTADRGGAMTIFSALQAFAQNTEDVPPESSQDAFARSVRLGREMRKIARDPDGTLPDLERRLTYLRDRRDTVAGIINLSMPEAQSRLDDIARGATGDNPRGLLKTIGIVRFIRESPNARSFRAQYGAALATIRSGARGVKASLLPGSARAEAMDILEREWEAESIEALRSGEIGIRKEALLREMGNQEERIALLLRHSLPERRAVLEKQRDEVKQALSAAETQAAFLDALRRHSLLLTDIEAESRSEAHWFFRLVYSVQDFLHM